MLHDYTSFVRQALAEQRAAPQAQLKTLSLGAAVLVVFYIAASVLLVPPSEEAGFNFVDERGAVTALSAVFLSAGAGFAALVFLVAPWPEKRYRLFWLALACAIGFLALDELLSFHERAGDTMYEMGLLRSLVDNSPLRNLNDAIVILYGVVALPLALCFLPGVLRVPHVFRLLLIAFGFYALHTLIDSVSEPPTLISNICEESAKLFSSCFIALAMLAGAMGTIAELRASGGSVQEAHKRPRD